MSEDTPGVVEGIATPISTPVDGDTSPAAETIHPAEQAPSAPASDAIVSAVVEAIRPALERINRDVQNLYDTLGQRRPE